MPCACLPWLGLPPLPQEPLQVLSLQPPRECHLYLASLLPLFLRTTSQALLRPPPGMLRSAPTVADQLAAVAPQANVIRPASAAMSRAPGGPVGTPRLPQPPIGTAARAPGTVMNPGSKAPGGPTTTSATRPGSRGASGPSPSIPDPPTSAPAGATASVPGPSKSGKKSSHEKLIEKLSTRYPQLSTDDLSRYINKLRERNNGKLSGMSVATIEQQA